ncbi:probable methyltransferase TARBP1 [Planococcus citri]|uniref:probable methyltransferase TARBP1 n=1 Tax=Planococcus citri TaxID=170843 RepID=UPI0031F808B3
MATHFTELSIVTAIECLNDVYYDEVVCNILISNLNLIDQHGIKVSPALKEKLSNFISNYLKNYNTFVDLEMEDFSQVISLISLLLEFQDSNDRCKTTEIVLPSLLASCDKILQSNTRNDGAELENLIKYFRLIETLLKCVSKLERNTKIYCVLTTLEDLLSKTFTIQNQSLLVYSFSVLDAYYHIVPETRLVYKIWSEAVANLLKERSYCEFYLIMISYLVGCSFGRKELNEILNTDEFWTALQLCLEDDQCIQKHALHVLKYASFNLCDQPKFCKLNHSSVFDCAHSKEYLSWWKTYFVIMENLDEKQTHLVLPTFSLVNNLLNDEIVSNDKFWILRLLENGLKHDSRTVRIEALLFLLDVNVSSFNKRHVRYIVRIMLTALNDSYLFRKSFKLNKFHNIKEGFVKCISNFDSEQLIIFYEMLIQIKWSPVPLFYTLRSITQTRQNFQCLDTKLIRMTADIIQNIVRYHNIKIRAAIQSLFVELILMYSEKNNDTALQVLTLMSNFNQEECLQRSTTSWQQIVEYLRQSSSYEDFELYLMEHASKQIDCDESLSDTSASFLARLTILLEDAFTPSNYHIRIAEWMSSFENVLHRAYLNKVIQNNRLKFIVNLLKIERSCVNVKNPLFGSLRYYSLAANHFTHLFTYIVKSLLECDNFDKIEFYEHSLTEFSYLFEDKFSSLINISNVQDWLVKSSEGLKNESVHRRYSSLKVISWIYLLIYRYPQLHINVDKWKNMLAASMTDYVNNFRIRSLNIEEINSSGRTKTGKLYSRFMNNLWSTMELYLFFEKENIFETVEISSLFDIILNALDLARKENLTSLFKFLKILFSMNTVLKYESIVLNMMSISWRLVEETLTTPFYTDSLKYWIRAFYQETFSSERIYQLKLIEYVNEMLKKVAEDGGQSYYSMILILTELSQIPNLFQRFPDAVSILINIFCISHINRKDQRIENETIEYIRGLGDNVSLNQIIKFDNADSAEEMRLMALNMLLNFCNERINNEKWIEIMKQLSSSDELSKKRYFNDSATHRIKHRRLQLLLIFETVLFNETSSLEKYKCAEKLFTCTVNSLLLEPHQPSVRYMLEWLLIRLIIHFGGTLEDKFWKCFLEASEERIGSICSFISIAFHLANTNGTESMIEMAIKSVLPWTMAQHFNARLYAQTVLAKLMSINSSISKNYDIIRRSLENSLKTGNAVKNSVKLQNDFYFSYFHPMDHFSLETILWHLPRLSNICNEEWIPTDLYEKFIITARKDIPIRNKDSNFATFSSSSWIAKATSPTHDDEKYSNDLNSTLSLQESQKKFIPQTDILAWTSLSADSSKNHNLIVVASLIDRAPNLGGLTRTCEIFAVSALVVNNLEVLKNKEYTSLSITAEKHVQINEVKKYNLFGYLKNKKEEGYCIIGLEQTTNSKNLSEFSFPKKSVLVLGNEKEGIPADLLCLFDTCVEIPQKGVIRSLNVHVSASLFIWEYAKQHVFGH